MSLLSDSQLAEIRSKVNIRDVISQYLPLAKRGQNYWALCPFHDDNNPSLSISEDKQIYKCFVCGAGGNVYTFVRDFEAISFVEAVVKVADTVGIDLSSSLQYQKADIDPKLEKYHTLVEDTVDFYRYQLKNTQDANIISLLENRQITDEIIDTFDVGLALSQNSLSNFLQAKQYQAEDMIAADLVRAYDSNLRDVFYDRLVFPIHNQKGKPVGFTGRAIFPENDVKYINTASTPIYTKGLLLYNIHRISHRDLRDQPVIVSEGVMDVIAFHRADVKKAIATLGTALSDEQAVMIKRLNSPVVLAFDKDKAGLQATYQIGSKLHHMNIKVSIYNNPTDLDPDDLQRQKGSASLKQAVETAKHWIEFVIDYATELYSLQSYQNKKDVVDFVLKQLNYLDGFDQTYFINQLATLTGFDSLELHQQLKSKSPDKTYQSRAASRTVAKENIDLLRSEKEILSLILESKQAAYYFRDNLGYLLHPVADSLSLMIIDQYRHHDTIEVADLLSKQLSEPMSQLLMSLSTESTIVSKDFTKVLEDDIKQIQLHAIDQQLTDLQKKAANELDVVKKIQYGEEITALMKDKDSLQTKGDKQ